MNNTIDQNVATTTSYTPAISAAGAGQPGSDPDLSPTQAAAFVRLLESIRSSPVTVLLGEPGLGKTTLIAAAAAGLGGMRIATGDLLAAPPLDGHPALEETVHRLVSQALDAAAIVFVEDIDLLCLTTRSPGYPRPSYLQVALQAWFERARTQSKRLIFTASSRDVLLPRLTERSSEVAIEPFTTADYRFFLERWLGARARDLDASRIFAAAPKLTTYQLHEACALAEFGGQFDEAAFIELLETRVLTSNVTLGEVARVTFADLKGCDAIIESLETFVVTPMRDGARFPELGLTPKRGVLLYGPPGTGKTSVGRALAHRLKGTFFMIDGTVISDTGTFYNRVQRIFAMAKHNTPSVIFIDDADVLMQSDRLYGLNRYLLTMLDGLESETSGMVTVMMTAMDTRHLPPALLRSGRIELWLPTQLPDAKAREQILTELLRALPLFFHQFDAAAIVGVTDGFNGADMKRLISDVKALYARDVLRGISSQPVDSYLRDAASGVRASKTLAASQGAEGDPAASPARA